jgi:hypothetical protein
MMLRKYVIFGVSRLEIGAGTPSQQVVTQEQGAALGVVCGGWDALDTADDGEAADTEGMGVKCRNLEGRMRYARTFSESV